ncbi:MAG: 23S rRNA (uracil(1939)-C(5))-methyltransferase RlmD [Candidatus Margulisbacteria bacterium]|nr:23S rRNA (uracil(1939)-C(5))-methyltransferase RlmD [Candidatus Margulisiibacteriota bacterium]
MHFYKKNEVVRAKVTSWGEKGLGSVDEGRSSLLLPDVLPGETITAKVVKTGKSWAYGKLLNVMNPSSARVKAVCDVAVRCGGCQLQHVRYDEQLAYKKDRVVQAFLDRKISSPEIIVHGMPDPLAYRQKGQFAISKTPDGDILMGLTAARSQRVIDTKKCWIQPEPVNLALDEIRRFLISTDNAIFSTSPPQEGIAHVAFRWTDTPSQLIVTLVSHSTVPQWETLRDALNKIPEFIALYLSINKNPEWSVLGPEQILLWGKSEVYQTISDLDLHVSAQSFSQSNAKQTALLWDRVAHLLKPLAEETIWDLYCGSGGMSMYLAKKSAKVIGIEENNQSIADAKINLERNAINHCEIIQGDVGDAIQTISGVCQGIVVNPPRKGLDPEVIAAILKKRPERMVYVSCSPDTLVRDLAVFIANGASIEAVEIVDFFPQTYHIETVVLLNLGLIY